MAVQLNSVNTLDEGVNISPSISVGSNTTHAPCKNVTKEVSFVQINLQKSKIASSIVCTKATEWSSKPLFIALQEPWIQKGGTIGNRPRDVQVFATSHSRAALMVSKDLHTWAMTDYLSGSGSLRVKYRQQ